MHTYPLIPTHPYTEDEQFSNLLMKYWVRQWDLDKTPVSEQLKKDMREDRVLLAVSERYNHVYFALPSKLSWQINKLFKPH